MRQLQDGAVRGSIPIRPDPLYTKLGFAVAPWESLLARFVADREDWRGVLSKVDVTRELKTSTAMHSAQTLTKRLVTHEKRHLDDLD
jgi:hypothetical protein